MGVICGLVTLPDTLPQEDASGRSMRLAATTKGHCISKRILHPLPYIVVALRTMRDQSPILLDDSTEEKDALPAASWTAANHVASQPKNHVGHSSPEYPEAHSA
ncbi:hypothetical protein FH972_025198 [Carpinus fangiana]|uniref:Uncharacterized protein n=1 Tax=Carpinus fangiana TaxID=176857 RepID=A0A5N6L0G8_9ROSI|nr:hypothetical protein FH972_025198 [Carpinus fangiana]